MAEGISQNRAPDLLVSLERIVEAMLCEVHVALPATVQRYDAAHQLADVAPTLLRIFLDENQNEVPQPYPVVTDAPVIFPQGGGGFLAFPLAVGDPVVLLCAQRSLDAWLETDGKTPIDPGDSRRHHISDAFVIPGARATRNPIPNASSADVVLGLTDASAEVHLKPGGHVGVVATDVKLGKLNASDPLALGNETQQRLAAIESWIQSFVTIAAPLAGSFPNPAVPAFTPSAASVKSQRVFTDM